jgi:hypothetical protein
MTLLSLVQGAADLLGIHRPTTVINSTDHQVRQVHALAVEEADELAASFNWQALTVEKTFTTEASAAQSTALPSDLSRFVSNSFFNRTTRRPVLGPITPQLWQNIQANPQLNRVVLAFRERDGSFLITPTPPAGQTIAYEYISDEWATSADGATAREAWTVDTDLCLLDERLIKLGIRWRWKKTKGLPYAEDYDTYQQQKDIKQARDGGSTILSLTGGTWDFLGNPTLPETGFGS